MVGGLISHIKSAFGSTLERSTQLTPKGLFENILSAGVVDVNIIEFVYFGKKILNTVTTFHIYPPPPIVFGALNRLSIVVDNHNLLLKGKQK